MLLDETFIKLFMLDSVSKSLSSLGLRDSRNFSSSFSSLNLNLSLITYIFSSKCSGFLGNIDL